MADRLALALHEGRGPRPGGALYQPLQEALGAHLESAVALGWHAADPQLRAYLNANVQRFSGFKTYAVQQALREKLTDAAGNLRPFADFRTDALAVHAQYNVRYLQTEYEQAIAGAQMASKWTDFAPGGLLRYDTAGDDHVRSEHAAYDGVTRPKDDPFWDDHYPPCDWGCRCSVTEVDDDAAVTPAAELHGLPAVPEEFRPNVGKAGEVFGPDHPYFDVPAQVAAAIEAQLPAAGEAAEAQYQADVKEVFVGGRGTLGALDTVKRSEYADVLPMLSDHEKAVVHNYTDAGYSVNRALRGAREATDYDAAYTRLLNGALDKMPAFEGQVYRGASLTPEALTRYQVGATVTEAPFTSSAREVDAAFDRNTRFEIYSVGGRSLEAISSMPEETEVLFKSGTAFQVLEVKTTEATTTIRLLEILVP